MEDAFVTAIRVLAASAGVVLIVFAFFWAMQVLTVKNADPPLLARLVFRGVRSVMYALGNVVRTRQRRQQIWALYVSVSLLAIVAIALAQILVGYTLVFYGISTDDLRTSYVNSVSSLSVLGFGGEPTTLAQSTLALAESFTGPVFVALLIAYLANMNSTVGQRQANLRTIEVKVGSAQSGPELLQRALAGPGLPAMTAIWQDWTREFVLARASFPTVEGYLLIFSPGMHNRWVADSEAVLDAANLRNAAFGLPNDPDAARCLVEGAATLKDAIDHSHHVLLRLRRSRPNRTVTRSQFDEICDDLARANAPIRPDRDAAWAAFERTRATYEDSICRLGQLMNVPLADWP